MLSVCFGGSDYSPDPSTSSGSEGEFAQGAKGLYSGSEGEFAQGAKGLYTGNERKNSAQGAKRFGLESEGYH